MNDTLSFTPNDVLPGPAAVLELQGIPAGREVSPKIAELCDAALDLFAATANPTGIMQEVDKGEFARVYEGDGRNDSSSPLGEMYRRADRLALFAVTLGPKVCGEIAARFKSNDLAVACMLDSVASVAADRLAEVVQRHVFALVGGQIGSAARVLHYSPGYCGWHISGQRALFARLHPESIGITLNERFLMSPLKSVSGVVVVGPGEIHDFDATYACCGDCRTHGCRERIAALNLE